MRLPQLASLILGFALALLATRVEAQPPLQPTEVLQSVERSLPLIERARQDLEVALGTLEEASGAFDLTVNSGGRAARGFYDNDRLSASIEQPLAPLGATAFAGYRAGRGVFAPSDSRAQTLANGELAAGIALPLLRDRAIDPRRADREISRVGIQIAERTLHATRLSAYRQAISVYWDWVSAGRQREVARALLVLAETRDQQLADSVSLGQVAPIERTDNRRAILQRRSALVAAERQLQLKAIDLSLYYRAATGDPERPAESRLPLLPRPTPPLRIPSEDEAVQVALARRPERQSLQAERDRQEVELRLAQNRVLPSLGLFAEAARDYGSGASSRAGSSFETGFTFQLPVQNRRGTGKRMQAQAKLLGVQQRLRWVEDQIRAEVQDALSALRAAADALDVIAEEVTVARELEELERERFRLGDSTQFLVNLRELTTAEAALREVRALADYQKASWTLEVSTGQALDRVAVP